MVKKILFVLLMTSLLRLVFFIINHHYFSDISSVIIYKAFIYSIRIDIATLLLINGFFLLFLTLFPKKSYQWQNIISTIFLLANGCLLFLIVCDNIYFSYTQHRITYEHLFLITQSFTVELLWHYCKEGWYWLLLLLIFLGGYKKLFKDQKLRKETKEQNWITRCVISIIILVICGIAIRGWESRPLSPSAVLLYFPSKIVNLASNTGFNLLYSYYKGQKQLPGKNYFTAAELDKRFTVFHQSVQKSNVNKPNIVLFVMESFAADYLDSSSSFKAYTPFLDSLMTKSLVFRNAFNNGRESTHGLVAILASLPPFMQLPYYHSQYHDVPIHGLGTILKESGYDCSFFLGDVDNSFGLKEFTHSIGIDHYYSRKDFNDDRYFNGAWGIHDENFFLYTTDVLAKKRQPFFAGIFNVSSHPPYIIPEKYQKKFTIPGQNAAQNSISYVDYSYRSFFRKVKNESWFTNTIFIFIADHFIKPSDKKALTAVNSNAIPFFIYAPGLPSLKGNHEYVVQQLDIVPTILELTGYNGRFMSFGKSVFERKGPRYAVQRMDYVFQIIDSSFVLGINPGNDAITYLYNYRSDTKLGKNLVNDSTLFLKKMELGNQLKAMIQRYNYSLQHNQLYY